MMRLLVAFVMLAGTAQAQLPSLWTGTTFVQRQGVPLAAADLNAAVAYAIQQGSAGALARLAADPAVIAGSAAGTLSLPGTTSASGIVKMFRQTSGQFDNAAVASIIANATSGPGIYAPGTPAKVLGYTPGLAAAAYPDIDSVALYAENTGRPPLFTLVGATFTVGAGVSRIVPPAGTALTSAQMAQLRRGMQVLTNHTNRWTAWVDSWDAGGQWVQVIEGFALFGAGPGVPNQNPTGSPVAGGGAVEVAFGPTTKAWVHNANCFLGGVPGDGFGSFAAKRCTGFEMGIFNGTLADHTYLGETDPSGGYSWGYDAVSLGSRKAGTGFVVRGVWDVAFQARAGATAGFMVDGGATTAGAAPGFLSTQVLGYTFAFRPGGPAAAAAFTVDQSGSIELGRQDAAGVRFIDGHSGGQPVDYDSRIEFSGGTSSVGQGGLRLVAAGVTIAGQTMLSTCPSAATGLPSGALWCSGTVVNRVP